MKKMTMVLVFLLGGVLIAGAGGGVAWWLLRQSAAGAQAGGAAAVAAPEPEAEPREYKYVSLDKVVVMLRSTEGAPMSNYMAMDLVFRTEVANEKAVKQQLPLLRSIAVKALSAYPLDKAVQMTVEEFAADINIAYTESYARERTTKPFVEAMVGKLIIE